jgi:hypothetical protein
MEALCSTTMTLKILQHVLNQVDALDSPDISLPCMVPAPER